MDDPEERRRRHRGLRAHLSEAAGALFRAAASAGELLSDPQLRQ
jgi:hypothetical protein